MTDRSWPPDPGGAHIQPLTLGAKITTKLDLVGRDVYRVEFARIAPGFNLRFHLALIKALAAEAKRVYGRQTYCLTTNGFFDVVLYVENGRGLNRAKVEALLAPTPTLDQLARQKQEPTADDHL